MPNFLEEDPEQSLPEVDPRAQPTSDSFVEGRSATGFLDFSASQRCPISRGCPPWEDSGQRMWPTFPRRISSNASPDVPPSFRSPANPGVMSVLGQHPYVWPTNVSHQKDQTIFLDAPDRVWFKPNPASPWSGTWGYCRRTSHHMPSPASSKQETSVQQPQLGFAECWRLSL